MTTTHTTTVKKTSQRSKEYAVCHTRPLVSNLEIQLLLYGINLGTYLCHSQRLLCTSRGSSPAPTSEGGSTTLAQSIWTTDILHHLVSLISQPTSTRHTYLKHVPSCRHRVFNLNLHLPHQTTRPSTANRPLNTLPPPDIHLSRPRLHLLPTHQTHPSLRRGELLDLGTRWRADARPRRR